MRSGREPHALQARDRRDSVVGADVQIELGSYGRTAPTMSARRRPLQERQTVLKIVDAGLDAPLRHRVAVEIAELVTGVRQAPDEMGAPFASRGPHARRSSGRAAPRVTGRVLGYEVAPDDPTDLALVLEDGSRVSTKAGDDESAQAQPCLMEEQSRLLRQPARVNVRPGTSGQRRRLRDRAEGIDAYGDVVFRRAPHSASIGVMELAPHGNTLILCRMSAEDRDQKLIQHFEGPWALCQREEALVPRMAIFAVNMSGTREVRPDRAGPPPPDVAERDDMLLVDAAIAAGWLEHVVLRDGDRIARDTLPGETLLRRWERNAVSLWLSTYGRRMDYGTDWLQLRALMMVSAAERKHSVTRLRRGALVNGPLAGRGHLGPKRFGFVRDDDNYLIAEKEGMRWVQRIFEIAASGEANNARGGLSLAAVAVKATAEGCPFSKARIGKILRDPIYSATGEWFTRVGEVLVQQEPPQNPWAISEAEFNKVQEQLTLRQGKASRTPLGEFIFNYVDVVHAQCGQRIAGYCIAGTDPGLRRLRHRDRACDCPIRTVGNRALVWEQDWLVPPIMRKLRELVEHPDVARQLTEAQAHAGAMKVGLDDQERAAVDAELEQIEQRLDEIADTYLHNVGVANASVEGLEPLTRSIVRRRDQIRRRLANDAAAKANDYNAGLVETTDRIALFLDLMSETTPSDELHKMLRARLFQTIVSRVEVDDDGSGEITITVHGRLVPEDTPANVCNPVAIAAALLDDIASGQSVGTLKLDRPSEGTSRDGGPEIETVSDASTEKTVSIRSGSSSTDPKRRSRHEVGVEAALEATTQSVRAARSRRAPDSVAWIRNEHPSDGRPSWVVAFTAERAETRAEPRRTWKDLVDSGVVAAGETLTGRQLGREWSATLDASGRIVISTLGTFRTPTAAASACIGGARTNGWHFWSVARAGRSMRLNEIRAAAESGQTI